MRLALVVCAAGVLAIASPSGAQDTAPAAEPSAITTEATPADQPVATEGAPAAAPAETSAPVAPAVTLPGDLTPPPPGKGQIVFFRPAGQPGMALTFTVRENEVAHGRLGSARYFVHVAEPGIHEYEVGNNDTMRMEIEDGETYFVMQRVQMGIVAGRAILEPSTPAAFAGALPRMRPARPIEE